MEYDHKGQCSLYSGQLCVEYKGAGAASPTRLNQHTVDTLLKADSSTYGRHHKTMLKSHTDSVCLHSCKQTIPLGGRGHFQGLRNRF